MKFKNFLHKKELVFTFGRMNPFTFGHYHLAKKLKDEAGWYKPRIYLSHTTNPQKDPLSYNDKIKFANDALIYYKDDVEVKKSKARTIIEVLKELESEGITDIALVVGSDRVREFKTLLDKYNGKEYEFNSIRVISAGKRDPDAEGVEGMSASKVREFAAKGDFENFKKSVPLTPKSAKELYDKVRKGMGIKEDLDMYFEELLTEGVHDQGIFKAVFLAGGPGSGKDYVLDNTLQGHGLTEINLDKAIEFLRSKKGVDDIDNKAKNTTELRQKLALKGRNGVIINGTGDDLEKVQSIKQDLEELGYDTAMIMVNTSDEVSAQRNIERGQRGGRTVPETVRKEKWDSAQDARTEYAKMFGDNYMEFDNSEDLRTASPDIVKQKKMEMMQLFKNVKEFVSQPPQSEKAQEWVANELQGKDTLDIPKDGPENIPPHDSNAAQEARKLGLQYYGFGRYGRNGKVTHRSVHDKLVEVQKDEQEKPKENKKSQDLNVKDKHFDKIFSEEKSIDEEFENLIDEDLRKWFDPKHPEGGWKRINSKGEAVGPCAREPGEAKPKCMSNEKRAKLSKKERASAVAVKRKHDPDPERKGKPINVSNFGKGKLSESYDLSDSGAMNLLLLGNSIDEIQLKEIEEEKEVKLLKDKSGRVRVFMLRAAAAREAHTMDGTVLKYKNGYVIKLKEEIEDVEIYQGTIRNWIAENRREAPTRRSSESCRGESQTLLSEATTPDYNNSCEKASAETTRPKISLAEIRQRKAQKEANDTRTTSCESTQINEIDRGIEPGISMAGAGESIGRDMGEKIKKRSHKVTTVEAIGAGGEMATSMSDNEELKLKRKGIDLQSFKAKRPIG